MAAQGKDRTSNQGVHAAPGLRRALWGGVLLWLLLLTVGFVAPGGWIWDMAGPIDHIENDMRSLWLVGLALAPLLTSRDPLRQSAAIQVYLLAVLAVCLSTFRGEARKWNADSPPLLVAALCGAAMLIRHPDRTAPLRW